MELLPVLETNQRGRMSNQPVFISVAFGERYVQQLKRLRESILCIYPGATMYFWQDELPPGSKPFLDSLYGFKVHGIKYARDKGHDKVVWLDPACIVLDKVDYLFELGLPVVAVKDESKLTQTICDKAVSYYGIEIKDWWHLVGGSLYGFSFDDEACHNVFNHWAKAESDGMFGSQDDLSAGLMNKHRQDESCMSMALYANGLCPLSSSVVGYNENLSSSVIKKHFR